MGNHRIITILLIILSIQTGYSANIDPDVVYERVIINGDTELMEYASSGTGTDIDPYILDLNTIFNTTADETRLKISYTTLYFEISGFIFKSPEYLNSLVELYNVQNGKFSNNTFLNGMNGIEGNFISNIIINNNYFNNSLEIAILLGKGIYSGYWISSDISNITINDNIINSQIEGVSINNDEIIDDVTIIDNIFNAQIPINLNLDYYEYDHYGDLIIINNTLNNYEIMYLQQVHDYVLKDMIIGQIIIYNSSSILLDNIQVISKFSLQISQSDNISIINSEFNIINIVYARDLIFNNNILNSIQYSTLLSTFYSLFTI